MNTLKTIQTLSKIGKILSKIVYICCEVGFCGCIVGIISLGCAELTVMEEGEHWFHTDEQMRFLDNWVMKGRQV